MDNQYWTALVFCDIAPTNLWQDREVLMGGDLQTRTCIRAIITKLTNEARHD